MDGQARKPDERVEGEKGTRTGPLRGICCMAGAQQQPNAIPTQSHCYVPNSMKSKRHAASQRLCSGLQLTFLALPSHPSCDLSTTVYNGNYSQSHATPCHIVYQGNQERQNAYIHPLILTCSYLEGCRISNTKNEIEMRLSTLVLWPPQGCHKVIHNKLSQKSMGYNQLT